jgi:hypothetical protein
MKKYDYQTTSEYTKRKLEGNSKINALMRAKQRSILMTGDASKIQTTADILALVDQVTEERKQIGFHLESIYGKYDYYGETLTPLYLSFVKDIFNQKFGPVTKKVIEAFGDTLKTQKESFPESYQKQKTSIKEVIEGVLYIHTNMSILTMKKYISQISEELGCVIKFKDPKNDSLLESEETDEIPF